MQTNAKVFGLVNLMCRMLFCLLFFCGEVHAQLPPLTFLGCKAPINVIFINGVDTNHEQADLHLAEFQKYAPKTTPSGQSISYSLAYNETVNVAYDALQAARQKYQQYTGFMTLYEAFSVFLADTIANSNILQGLPPAIAVQIQQDAEAFKRQTFINSLAAYVASAPDLQKIYTQVRKLPKSQALLLLGHSQGNLFANQLYQLLVADGFDAAALTTVGVAVPASTMRGSVTGSEQYVTSKTDLLLQLLKLQDPLTLAPNFLGGVPTLGNTLGHGFRSAYLDSTNLRTAIVNIFTQAIGGLKTTCNPPPVEVTVSGSQPGWTVSPKITLANFLQMPRVVFSLQGTPGNTCGGERGGPLYSLDSAIDPQAEFYGPQSVQGAPYMESPNRRPCSSFVAYKFYPDPADPSDLRKSKPRFWINATARAQTFFGGFPADREYQLRIDTGDPFNGNQGFRCDAGTVANPFGGWFKEWSPTSCSAKFVAQ